MSSLIRKGLSKVVTYAPTTTSEMTHNHTSQATMPRLIISTSSHNDSQIPHILTSPRTPQNISVGVPVRVSTGQTINITNQMNAQPLPKPSPVLPQNMGM